MNAKYNHITKWMASRVFKLWTQVTVSGPYV